MIAHEREVQGETLKGEALKDVVKKVLISPDEGWKGYVMRVFELGPGGYTPKHEHPWPHINYILSGHGTLHLDGIEHDIETGSFAYVPDNKLHQFKNCGDQTLKFICIVPEEGDK